MKLEDLRTDNFVLRPLKNSDKEDLLDLLNNPSIEKYIPGLAFHNLEEVTHLFIVSQLHNSILLVLEEIASKKIIGIIFAYIDPSFLGSISYVMHKDYRGRGIMPEALKLFIRYLYENKLARCITFCINISNKSSIRVMQKLNIPFCYSYFHLSLTQELPF